MYNTYITCQRLVLSTRGSNPFPPPETIKFKGCRELPVAENPCRRERIWRVGAGRYIFIHSFFFCFVNCQITFKIVHQISDARKCFTTHWPIVHQISDAGKCFTTHWAIFSSSMIQIYTIHFVRFDSQPIVDMLKSRLASQIRPRHSLISPLVPHPHQKKKKYRLGLTLVNSRFVIDSGFGKQRVWQRMLLGYVLAG